MQMRHNVKAMNQSLHDTDPGMTTLYDSEAFIVVHMYGMPVADSAPAGNAAVELGHDQRLERDGFEIVDKRSGRHVYLDGRWAELFEKQILAWRTITPTQEEVEDTLEHFTGLAGNPIVLH